MCTYSFACFMSVPVAPGVAVLESDDRILYDSDEHLPYIYAAGAVIVLVAFGVPLATAGLLFVVHRRIEPVNASVKARVGEAFRISADEAEAVVNDIQLGSQYGYLTNAFKPQFFFAESLDM
jgi:hypothetical protein